MLASQEPAAGAIVLAFASGTTVDSWLASPGYELFVDALSARLMADVDDTRRELSVRADLDAYRTLTDAASAVAYAPRLRRSRANVLMLMAEDDEMVPNSATEALAEALGAALVNADPRHVPGLATAVLRPGSAIRGNFRAEGAKVTRVLQHVRGATHDALVQAVGTRRYETPLAPPFDRLEAPRPVENPTEALLEQIAFFFESYRACLATREGPCDAAVHALELD
jgi:hypothetical protein